MKRIRILAVLVAALAIAAMVGCGTEETTTVNKGQLALSIPPPNPGSDGVTTILIQVYGPLDGQHNCTDALPTLADSATVQLEQEYLPSGLDAPAPQAGNHKFTDKYFNLLAGDYCVKATPQGGACGIVLSGPYTVNSSITTEVTLVSNCLRDDTGGLDVVATLNNDPLIESLVFDPSKFVSVCESLTVRATAVDPDADPLTWTWSPLPTGCVVNEPTSAGSSMTCYIPTAGVQSVTVTACDPGSLCANLTFPIHVSGNSVSDCND